MITRFLSALAVAFALNGAAEAALTPAQTYLVPLPEDQARTMFATVNPNPTSQNIQSITSIAAAINGTVIHYDHWEDGYEDDITNPVQPSTEIWGDSDLFNGVAPGTANDLINSDTIVMLQNVVDLPRDPNVIRFDGRDRFASNNVLAVTRALWPTSPGSVLAGAMEVYPLDGMGTFFRLPVGENTPSNNMFEYTSAAIMASRDNTVVDIDADNNGVFESTVNLNRGESHLIPSTATVNAGARLSANQPVQVHLLTGDIGAIWESRWYTLFPTEQWSNSYVTPVSTRLTNSDDPTDVFLYNPNPASLTVHWETVGTTVETDISVPSGGVARQRIPNGTGARFFSDGPPFFAISATDANRDIFQSSDNSNYQNRDYDWGFTLVPEALLSTQALVGFGWGADRTTISGFSRNGSPVWVTPIADTTVYVDFKNSPSTAAGSDPDGNPIDAQFNLQALQQQKVFDLSDNDQTGMLFYTLDGTRIAVAYGQDPESAVRTNPFLDLGTTVPSLPRFTVGKSAVLFFDANNDGQPGPGDELLYTVQIRNSSRSPIPFVLLADNLPDFVNYVAGTTELDDGAGITPVPDDTVGTPFPLDEGGFDLGALPPEPNNLLTVTFVAAIDPEIPDDVECIINTAIASAFGRTRSNEVETCLVRGPDAPAIDIETATNGEDADNPTGPVLAVGGAVNWTYVVTNTGSVALSNVVVTDDQGVAVSCPQSTLAVGESMTCTASGTAAAGQYANIGSVNGTDPNGVQVSDSDPSHYFGATSAIDIEKATNGEDADNPTGPVLAVGGAVNWTYVVTNTGNVALSNVVVTDDQGVAVSCPQNTLAVGESMTCTASGTAAAGQYANIGSVNGTDPNGVQVSDSDPSHYFGATPAIDIETATNGEDADNPTGPVLAVGGAVNWTYVVTNTGSVALSNVVVTDDQGVAVSCPQSTLAVGESMTCTASGTAAAGQYANIGSVSGTDPNGVQVSDSDPSHYLGEDSIVCVDNGSIASNFNGTAIAPGNWLWFNSNFRIGGGTPQPGTTILVQNATITLSPNGMPVIFLNVPDAAITFDNVALSTTEFNEALNRWETTVPLAGSDEILLTALAFWVDPALYPNGIPGGTQAVTWQADVGLAQPEPGFQISWKWSAAVYTFFTDVYDDLGVKPTHTDAAFYDNSHHAGTPENYLDYVTGGARGGGGSNWTGSFSGTQSLTLDCVN